MDRSTLTHIIDVVLKSNNSEEILKLTYKLPKDPEEALGRFCYLYEIGNFIYEQMILQDVSIFEELEHVRIDRFAAEADTQVELRELQTQ